MFCLILHAILSETFDQLNYGIKLQSWILIFSLLQFERDFAPQAKLEEAFIYINHKPIDFSIYFSYRLRILGQMVIGLKHIRVPIGT